MITTPLPLKPADNYYGSLKKKMLASERQRKPWNSIFKQLRVLFADTNFLEQLSVATAFFTTLAPDKDHIFKLRAKQPYQDH